MLRFFFEPIKFKGEPIFTVFSNLIQKNEPINLFLHTKNMKN